MKDSPSPISRPPVEEGKRQRLTKFEFAVLFRWQGGLCGCGCGEPLEEGKIDEDHTIPNYFRPGKPDCLLRRECHKRKTKEIDGPAIDKTKRLRGETRACPKKKIANRGFQGHRNFKGEIV